MIWECLEIFKKEYERLGDQIIIDNYVPKDGIYYTVLMKKNDEWKLEDPLEIKFDKKTGNIEGYLDTKYSKFCFLDYYSKLIDMNKSIDKKKIIHSNNYLSFFIRKESLKQKKLTEEIIDEYFKILENPYLKYKDSNTKKLYQDIEKSCGAVDINLLKKIQTWIQKNIFSFSDESEEKNYLKLFFVFEDWEETEEIFKKESKRYLIPNIYLKNKYNRIVQNQIVGLPNNNLQMNDKKPYICNLSRKITVPFLLNQKDILIQGKFYDYLEGFASKKKYDIYFDVIENKIIACKSGENPSNGVCGYFIRIKKGKTEAEIHCADTVVDFNTNLKPEFYYRMIIPADQSDQYGMINKISVIEKIVDEVLFDKRLISNYFTEANDIKIYDGILKSQILAVRERLFTWFHRDININMNEILHNVGWKLICNTVKKGFWNKAKNQINLIWSLEDYFNGNREIEKQMNMIEKNVFKYLDEDEWEFQSDKEYYFAVGQILSYFIGKSQALKAPMSLANPILNAGKDEQIKQHLTLLFKKYSYTISYTDKRVKNLIGHIMMYEPNEKINTQMIAAGLTMDNLIFRKKEKKDNE